MKTLCVDFDGVVHSYTSGWQGATVISDPPVIGAFDALNEYLKCYKVAIYSSRSKETEAIEAMKQWFIVHGFQQVDELWFPTQKPAAYLTIDDRAICFNGVFPTIPAIEGFSPWYKDLPKERDLGKSKYLPDFIPHERAYPFSDGTLIAGIEVSGNTVSFTGQTGPVKMVGLNGCQIDEIIKFARWTLQAFNCSAASRETSLAITKLEEAEMWLKRRTEDREKRGVEGTYGK